MKTEGRFDLPQGTLDLLIMRVVALGTIHCYAIAQRIQQMSHEALQVLQGSLYPALHRLEYKKLLAATWKPSETETGNWSRLTTLLVSL
jgi:PadR family transcriptional regulator, regulatory protein PadR